MWQSNRERQGRRASCSKTQGTAARRMSILTRPKTTWHVGKPLLVSEEKENDYHRRTQQMIVGIVSQQAQLGERVGKKFGEASGNRVCIGASDPVDGDCFVRESIHRISPCNRSQRGTRAVTVMAGGFGMISKVAGA